MDIHDPHTGYYNWDKKESRPGMNKDDLDNAPSKIFTVDEIVVPNFFAKNRFGETGNGGLLLHRSPRR